MTFNNSILLILKQSPGNDYKNGLEYNELFSRIVSRYKTPASARSALARSLKDLTAFGLIKREKNMLFLTDKGVASISIEMKEKLVLKLNDTMKKPLTNLEDIVKLLVILHQRSVQSPDLLKNAKENASFTIHEVQEIRKKIHIRRKFLKKMDLLLADQIEKLKQLDFNDSFEMDFDQNFALKVRFFSVNQKVVAEIRDEEILAKLPDTWKKQSSITVEGDTLGMLFQLLLERPSVKANLYLPGIKVVLLSGKAKCFGSFSNLRTFAETKTSDTPLQDKSHAISSNAINSTLPQQPVLLATNLQQASVPNVPQSSLPSQNTSTEAKPIAVSPSEVKKESGLNVIAQETKKTESVS